MGYDKAKTFKKWSKDSIKKIAEAMNLTPENIASITSKKKETFKSKITGMIEQYLEITENHKHSLE